MIYISRSARRGFAALLLVGVSLAAGMRVARAADAPASDDKTAQARGLSQEANALYAVGEFEQAAEKYQSAYKVKPDPALLYNAAQSYRMAGNNEKALLLYKNYAMFYPSAKNIHNAETQISKLQEAIAAQHKAQTQPPTTTEPTPGTSSGVPAWTPPAAPSTAATVSGTTPASTTPPLPAAVSPQVSGAPNGATLTEAAPPPSAEESPGKPIYKKWWFWTAVGAVAAGSVAVVLLSGRSSTAWSTAPDFGPGAK